MTPEIVVEFPGGVRVDALVGEYVVHTDQPRGSGGEGSAPAPFDLFAASLATCAGYFVLAFCRARGIEARDLRLRQRFRFDEQRRLAGVDLDIELPAGFPEKYRDTLVRVAEGCTAKRAIEAAPAFSVRTLRRPEALRAE